MFVVLSVATAKRESTRRANAALHSSMAYSLVASHKPTRAALDRSAKAIQLPSLASMSVKMVKGTMDIPSDFPKI